MADKKNKGKKNRKIGRSKRKPSHIRYTAEKRWETNKARRIAKQKRKEEKDASKRDSRKNRIIKSEV
jgi:hypothetical protein